MLKKTFYFSLILFFFYFHTACNHTQPEPKTINPNEVKEPLINANQHMVKVETEDINNYISRHEWDMQQTGTGLRYIIYKNGKGKAVVQGNKVTLNFRVNLITGQSCYNSKEDGPMEFITGNAEVINGLEEAIMLMHEGDKAKVIIPSHLAYGLLGDEKLIPKRATLIYDIELVRIN